MPQLKQGQIPEEWKRCMFSHYFKNKKKL